MELLARFKTIAPEFYTEFDPENDQFLSDHLEIASEFLDPNIRQPLLDNLIVYLAAHNIDLALKRKGSSGQVESLTEGDLTIKYSTGDINSEYDMSSYGRKFQALLDSSMMTIMTSVTC